MIGTGLVKHAELFRKIPPLKRERKNTEKKNVIQSEAKDPGSTHLMLSRSFASLWMTK